MSRWVLRSNMVRDVWVRRLLAADLGLFNVGLIFFAYLPPVSITPQEYVAIGLSVFALIGVISQAFYRIKLPGERWAYLITAMTGLYVFLAYAHLATNVEYWIKIPYLIFISAGVASAAAAHVIVGGPREDDV